MSTQNLIINRRYFKGDQRGIIGTLEPKTVLLDPQKSNSVAIHIHQAAVNTTPAWWSVNPFHQKHEGYTVSNLAPEAS